MEIEAFKNIPSPCYILDEAVFLNNLKTIASIRDEAGIEIILALKGFALWKAFHLLKPYIQGATASSLNEALLVKEEMSVLPHVYAPVYTPKDLQEILPIANSLSFNSLSQWERYSDLCAQHPNVSYGLRINPGYSPVETALYNPCAPGTRLGVALSQLPTTLPEQIKGLHVHNLCESNSEALQKTLNILAEKIPHLLEQISWLNLGGGHLMTRADYQKDTTIELLKNFREKHYLHIILEPSAAFVWQAGYLKTTVLDVVEDMGIKTAMIDASFTAHMPDCLEMPYQPNVIGATKNQGSHLYRLGGTTCLSGDFLGNYGFEKPLEVGDNLIFEDMIQYTMVKTTHFNGVRHPSIGMIKSDGHFEMMREFGFQDYKSSLC